MNRRNASSGQTILELVVALGIVALILTGLIAAVTSSLRFGQQSRVRSVGLKYAQEGIERVRKLRDEGTWDVFLAYSGTGSQRWCLSLDGSFAPLGESGCPITPQSTFWRTITFRFEDPLMIVSSEVSWGERVEPSLVVLTTYLTQWK